MSEDPVPDVTISAPPPDLSGDAIQLLCGKMLRGELPSGLLAACRGRRLVGAVAGLVQAGHAAEVLPPRLVPGEPSATAGWLLQRLDQTLQDQGVRFAYAYLCERDETARDALQRQDYQRIDDVLFLSRGLDDIGPDWGSQTCYFRPWVPAEQQGWQDLIAATQRDSLDFPQLHGLREIGDLVAGYAATGDSGQRYWRICQRANYDVGCLLVADHAQRDQCELVYMGLIPAARGRGWGRRLLRHALWLAKGIGRQQVILAVAAGNDPGIAAYASAGFVVRDRRRTWFRVF